MTKFRSALQIMLGFIIAAALFSCGGLATKTTTDTTKVKDSTAAAKPAAAPAMAAPFDVVEIAATVKDYAQWRPGYNGDTVARKSAGMEDIVVGRGVDSANQVVVYEKISDVAKAKAFTMSPELKGKMAKSGVISKPYIGFFHVIRFNADSKAKQWIVVTHKVKDFDAWVKVYDGEGKDKRASEGMVDVVLARGIDDPNEVQLVFDITDMAKAKAAIASEDKKKLMMSAGVMGAPSVKFYSEAQ